MRSFLPLVTLCISLLGVALPAWLALIAYRNQTRTKTAEFLLALHKSFFVDEFYKTIRDQIDSGSAEAIDALVKEETPAFTDFLNFFELVAYMEKQGTLSNDDIAALLGHYLRILCENASLTAYIADSKNGFEHLKNLVEHRVE
jgi:hypothetical protein